MPIPFRVDDDALAALCHRWKISELALFGSALREDFRDDSDVDLLVTFAPDAARGLFRLVDLHDELEGIFGRKVDLVSRGGLDSSPNYLRRDAILSSAQTLYAA